MLQLRRRTRGHLLALTAAILFGLEWQMAASLGFYEDDFAKAWAALGPSANAWWPQALDRFLSDEPLFHLYQDLRFQLLGFAHPSWHHVLPGTAQIANVFLVYLLAWRLSRSLPMALSAAFLFGAFPGLGQAQYWTSAIYVPLLTLVLSALVSWIAWLRSGKAGFRPLAVGLYVAAVFTHEAAFGALAIFAAVWLWERRRLESWLELAPFAATNLAYLAIRQTLWFGLGRFSLTGARELSAASVPELAFASFNLNFGPWFWTRTAELASAAPGDFGRSVGLAAGLTLAGVWCCGPSTLLRRSLLAGFAAAAVIGLGLAWWFGLAAFLRGFYLFVAIAAAYAVWERRAKAAVFLCAFGLLWFAAMFAPAWTYYIAFRHSYIPAVGAALVLAGLCHAVGGRRALRGVSWGFVCCLCAIFHLAALGEARAWVRYHQDIETVRTALQSRRPAIEPSQAVALVGLPGIRDGHPVFTDLGFEPAAKLWLNDASVRAARRFSPLTEGYRTAAGEELQPYSGLRLFRFSEGGVREVGIVVLSGGERIELSFGDPDVVFEAGESSR